MTGIFGGVSTEDLVVSSNRTISASITYTNAFVTNNATLTVQSGAVLTISETLIIDYGATLTLNNATLTVAGVSTILGALDSTNSSDVMTLSGNTMTYGIVTVNSGATLTFSGTTNEFYGSFSGTGTVSISNTLTINSSFTTSVALAGSGTLSIGSGVIWTISGSVTWTTTGTITGTGSLTGTITLSNSCTISIANLSGSISISSTVTVGGATQLWISITLSGSGTLTVPSPNILTISGTLNVATIAGSGTLYQYTSALTISSTVTWSITNILVSSNGMSVNGALTITGSYFSTQTISTNSSISGSGTITFNPTSGTMTINSYVAGGLITVGCVWGATTVAFVISAGVFFCFGGTHGTTSSYAMPSPNGGSAVSGAGVWIASPSGAANATNVKALSATAVAAGGSISTSKAGTNLNASYIISEIEGSVSGQYTLGVVHGTTYLMFFWTYIGSSAVGSPLTLVNLVNPTDSANDGSVNPTNGYASSTNPGTITLWGDLYV